MTNAEPCRNERTLTDVDEAHGDRGFVAVDDEGELAAVAPDGLRVANWVSRSRLSERRRTRDLPARDHDGLGDARTQVESSRRHPAILCADTSQPAAPSKSFRWRAIPACK